MSSPTRLPIFKISDRHPLKSVDCQQCDSSWPAMYVTYDAVPLWLLQAWVLLRVYTWLCCMRGSFYHTWQVEQKPGGRGRGREWATLGVHPLSWLLSNNQLEKVPFVSVPHTSSNRLLLSNQDKGCTPSVAHSLALPLGPALLNLWSIRQRTLTVPSKVIQFAVATAVLSLRY